MAYSEYIANTILDSFKNNPIGTKQKYSVNFHESLQNYTDVKDTVDYLISENKVKASVSKSGQSIIVTDERL
ncbi:hypothetical protein ACLZX5_14345 [Enterococcus faecium]|uniref:hypothetical protein n=1 Tax=Enterococcus innesii TaxID=2839759 RepID=UPI0034A4CCED